MVPGWSHQGLREEEGFVLEKPLKCLGQSTFGFTAGPLLPGLLTLLKFLKNELALSLQCQMLVSSWKGFPTRISSPGCMVLSGRGKTFRDRLVV